MKVGKSVPEICWSHWMRHRWKASFNALTRNIQRQRLDAAIAISIISPLTTRDPTDVDFVQLGSTAFRQGNSSSPEEAELVKSVLSAVQDEIFQVDAQSNSSVQQQSTQQARIAKAQHLECEAIEALRKQGTISKSDYLQRLREHRALTSEVLIAERELVGLQAEAQAMLRKRKGLISATLSNYRKQRNEAEINLRGLEAERRALEGQVADLTIEAPVSGKVERLSVFTVGGFVEAGSTLMSIVPTDEDIEIDFRDVGFLEPGQRAIVKFDAFPSERFGVILGKVSTVGADARGDVEAGKWVYNIRMSSRQKQNDAPWQRSQIFARHDRDG